MLRNCNHYNNNRKNHASPSFSVNNFIVYKIIVIKSVRLKCFEANFFAFNWLAFRNFPSDLWSVVLDVGLSSQQVLKCVSCLCDDNKHMLFTNELAI